MLIPEDGVSTFAEVRFCTVHSTGTAQLYSMCSERGTAAPPIHNVAGAATPLITGAIHNPVQFVQGGYRPDQHCLYVPWMPQYRMPTSQDFDSQFLQESTAS